MSKAFLCPALLFSVPMLFVAFPGSSKPPVLLFRLLAGSVSAYKLFGRPSQARGGMSALTHR
jgi:hypothetical protein